MAARLPIVSTGVGGIPEVIDDRRSGVLVPANDPDALAAAICRIIAEPERARHLGEAGWRTVTSSFALNHLADCYDTIYENALRAA
jgi:glycosyltransferase involved in cell wall biosynthesis